MAYVWKENTDNIITIFADENAEISCYSKKRGSSVAMSVVSGKLTYMGDGIWELFTRLEPGDYIIRITVDGAVVNKRLVVLTLAEYYDGCTVRYLEME